MGRARMLLTSSETASIIKYLKQKIEIDFKISCIKSTRRIDTFGQRCDDLNFIGGLHKHS